MRKLAVQVKMQLRILIRFSLLLQKKKSRLLCGWRRPPCVLRSLYVQPKNAEAHLSVAAAPSKVIIGLHHPILATTSNHIAVSLSESLR